MQERTYIAIDLKSFYASVECVARGLDPLNTNLVVADSTRTDKTICLAVTPSLKAFGIPGRPRLFEVVQRVKEINTQRRYRAPRGEFNGKSYLASELQQHPDWQLDYITAPPQMARYMQVSTQIYGIYLRYVAPEDIHVYSVDEVFMDVTCYLKTYRKTPWEFAMMLIREVLAETGITATAGIGTNLYLSKVAMDIVAKRVPADENGVRIAALDEESYRLQLWNHRPLTDFWRVGRGYAEKLEERGIYTMGDIARCSIGGAGDVRNEEMLYKLFGVNAELLIDHAWGWEPTEMGDIKTYTPESCSLSSGQVLKEPYEYEKARLVVREMADGVALDLTEKHLLCDQMVLTVGYDIGNLTDPERRKRYKGPIEVDGYGRAVPKGVHGSCNLEGAVCSSKEIVEAITCIFDRIVSTELTVRRMYVVANHVVREDAVPSESPFEQLNFFTDYEKIEQKRRERENRLQREKRMQEAVVYIKRKYGKNAILRGMNLKEGATTVERNGQVGGHKA